jgi:hypothetical protein
LWHQQTLQDAANSSQISGAVNEAVKEANLHSDGQFQDANQHSDRKFKEVENDLTGLGNAVDAGLKKATGEINTNLVKIGKPEPPTPAVLTFSLWSSEASLEKPLTLQYVPPDSDGNFPVDFTFGNSSQSSAKSIDIWIQLCELCSFAKEPDGFEHPAGVSDQIRHRRMGDLNSGMTVEKMTILIKAPRSQNFQIAFRYACENCGGKVSANQVASITEGIVGPEFPVNVTPQ